MGIKYHVASDGSVVYDGATGGTATEKSFAKGFMAWFDKGRTGVFVNLVAEKNGYTPYANCPLGRLRRTPRAWRHGLRPRLGRPRPVGSLQQVRLASPSRTEPPPDSAAANARRSSTPESRGRRRTSGAALFGVGLLLGAAAGLLAGCDDSSGKSQQMEGEGVPVKSERIGGAPEPGPSRRPRPGSGTATPLPRP